MNKALIVQLVQESGHAVHVRGEVPGTTVLVGVQGTGLKPSKDSGLCSIVAEYCISLIQLKFNFEKKLQNKQKKIHLFIFFKEIRPGCFETTWILASKLDALSVA